MNADSLLENWSLEQVEGIAFALYNSANQQERQQAKQICEGMLTRIEYIDKVQVMLRHSNSVYCLALAASSLVKLIDNFWNQFSNNQVMDLLRFLLGFMFDKGISIELYVNELVVQSFTKLLKLGWENNDYSQLLDEIKGHMMHTPRHCLTALMILSKLVSEMNTSGNMRNSKHRKICVSFRDKFLKDIFQLSLSTMNAILSGAMGQLSNEDAGRLRKQVMTLSIGCLSFDFVGSNPDDSEEEASVLQIPSEWVDIFANPQMIELFFGMFRSSSNVEAKDALECIRLAVTSRRSLFEIEQRAKFFSVIVYNMLDIMKNSIDKVEHEENHHNMCRLILQTKRNYRLSEILATPHHLEWLETCAEFTMRAIRGWTDHFRGVHYLLGFWTRLVSDLPHLRIHTDIGETLFQKVVPVIASSVIQARCQAIPQAVSEDSLDEMFEEYNMHMELSHLPPLFRFRYEITLQFINDNFCPLVSEYKQILQSLEHSSPNNIQVESIIILECRLATFVYLIGALVGSDRSRSSNQLKTDARICAWLFEFVSVVEVRLSMSQLTQSISKNIHLELSILYFFNQFREMYLCHVIPTSQRSVSYGGRLEERMFQELSELLNTTMTPESVLNNIVTKIILNLTIWNNDDVLLNSNTLLNRLALEHGTSSMMVRLASVGELLRVHGPKVFPFLADPQFEELHVMFYHTLGRIALKEEHVKNFDSFMLPMEEILCSFQQSSGGLHDMKIASMTASVCRCLNGVVKGCLSSSSYKLFFDWIYPRYLPLVLRLLETYWDNSTVAIPILDFYNELTHNKSDRINFDAYSPNSIVLFHEISKVVNLYAGRVVTLNLSELEGSYSRGDKSDLIYNIKLAGISRCLQMLTRALMGEYVNFGVMNYYKDQSVVIALHAGIKLIIDLPLKEALEYDEVAQNYFHFLEILFRNHCNMVEEVEQKVLFELMSSLYEGITGFNQKNSSIAATAMDNLFSYRIKRKTKKYEIKREESMIEDYFSQTTSQILAANILVGLFNMVVFDKAMNIWSLAKPICSIIICHEEAFNMYKEQLMMAQTPEVRQTVAEALDRLMQGIQPNADTSNKDLFLSNLQYFAMKIQSNCVRPS